MQKAIAQIVASDETSNHRTKAIAILSFLISKITEDKAIIGLTSLDISKALKVPNESLQRAIYLLEKLHLVRRVHKGAGNRKVFIILELEKLLE